MSVALGPEPDQAEKVALKISHVISLDPLLLMPALPACRAIFKPLCIFAAFYRHGGDFDGFSAVI